MSLVLLTTSTNATRELQHVRNAVNERARSIGASDDKRRAAVGKAFSLMKMGHSSAWSVAEACRLFAGKAPAVHGGYPTPPVAA